MICFFCDFLQWIFSHLELVLLAAQVGSLLLPEVVRLDDVRRVDCVPKMVLQHLVDTR